jgi:quinoprotein glucose dehydrogenase
MLHRLYRRVRNAALVLSVAVLIAACVPSKPASSRLSATGSLPAQTGEWLTWGGDAGNTRYSPLDQIDKSNVSQLRVIGRWQAEPLPRGSDTNWKATPLYVGGVLYVPTGGSKVAAIDPASGQTMWLFTPEPLRVGTRPFSGSSRAVSYWSDGRQQRILHNSIDGRLFSIDAATGKLDAGFGRAGVVNLNENLLDPDDARQPDDMGSTGPGIVVGDVIVVQVIGNDTPRRNQGTPGYIRGYDVRTGKMLWKFHTIPRVGEFGVDTWENGAWRSAGAASVWSMMSADPELGYVYLPIESSTNNFWGGQRAGNGLFGESLVCLDAKTGKRVWHFQILHHGVWDYDLPAAPILHDIRKEGRTIRAVTVLTKQGMSFVFDRVTGEPVWPIEERAVPTSMGVPGEKLSPTQPFPTKPPPYSRLGYHEADVIDFTPELRAEALMYLEQFVKGPMYTPPTLVGPGIATRGTLVYPNFGGGSNWNGGAIDMETNVMFVPTRNTFMAVGLRRADPKLTDWEYTAAGGDGARPLRLPNGLPVNRPPWALVTATDMNRGEHVWSRAIGGAPDSIRNHPALKGLELDFDQMGQLSVRPSPLVTRSLLFLAESGNIGGDPGGQMFRAYDKATGNVVAELELPAKTSGAPMTYLHAGRQYIAVALSEQRSPAELIVLALPRAGDPPNPAASIRPPIRSTGPSTAADRVVASSSQLALGGEVYRQSCAACHGPRGEGVAGSNAPPLQALGSLDDVKLMVGRGSAEMPPMAAMLTPEQIDAVSRYVLVQLAAP